MRDPWYTGPDILRIFDYTLVWEPSSKQWMVNQFEKRIIDEDQVVKRRGHLLSLHDDHTLLVRRADP